MFFSVISMEVLTEISPFEAHYARVVEEQISLSRKVLSLS